MAFFPPGCVLRGFRAATYKKYVSPQPLVRPCPPKKILIYELETPFCAQPDFTESWMGTAYKSFRSNFEKTLFSRISQAVF